MSIDPHRTRTFARWPALFAATCLLACGGAACGGADGPAATENEGAPRVIASPDDRPASCPESAPAPEQLRNVSPAHRTLDFWLGRATNADRALLTPEGVEAHAAALLAGDDPPRQPALDTPLDDAALRTQLEERLAYVREKLTSGAYVDAEGQRITELDAFQMPASLRRVDTLHVTTAPVRLRCAPRAEGFYTPSRDLAFDRNNCSTVRGQEPIEVLAQWGSLRLARTGYALGWLAEDAALSPPVPAELRAAILTGTRTRLTTGETLAGVPVPAGTAMPMTPNAGTSVYVGTSAGVLAAPVQHAVQGVRRPLTRRAVLTEAFSLLDSPYGWGGHEGGRDCSRFLLDIFATFGLPLPRHSARQATSGTFQVDVESMPSREKLLLIESAQQKGIVLLHFPGHIMLYLGRDDDGRPYAIHSFSEYVEPCEGLTDPDGAPIETLRRVDRVAVSDLSLGEGSSRTDFLSRISRVVVIGGAPGPELGGAAQMRPAAPVRAEAVLGDARCDDNVDAAVFRTPFRPNSSAPLRVMVTTTEDPGPVTLTLFDDAGERIDAELHRTGGPPFGYWVEVDRPSSGRWTAVLGDGPRVVACERFVVARHPPEIIRRALQTPAWIPAWSWERDTENLFAAFVEQLFLEPRLPEGQEETWHGLQVLLNDRDRNLLHNHLLQDEEAGLDLTPDCADLPYFLRAYFAWKLRLPFAWRQCRRGREGRPPECSEVPATNLMLVDGATDVLAFRSLARTLGQNVHSSTQRTVPTAEASDVYPIPLTREALRPGTVFADPYGHVLVVAMWIPQGLDQYGMLVGADAQPDGTIGRRRFWRGSFLFTPETSEAGSGFKAWRPPVYDRREETIVLLTNDELRGSTVHTPYSSQQYDGSMDDFYDRVDGLINPRPLDADVVQRSLVDALEEGVTRRIGSVDNGETFMRERGFRTIEMPEGAAIFQTEGPWEDYSTPSRDMRLLISIDAVLRFPEVVSRHPERYGLEAGEVDVEQRRAALTEMLAGRGFEYTRSDGSTVPLTLKDVADRRVGFEMSYNPNDCVEIRWAAPEGSDEASTCRRHAPAGQRTKMARHRPWFETRQRPAR